MGCIFSPVVANLDFIRVPTPYSYPKDPCHRRVFAMTGERSWVRKMPMPAPFFDGGWNWPSSLRDQAKVKQPNVVRPRANENSPGRVLWELGLVLAVPLAGAGLVELILRSLRIY